MNLRQGKGSGRVLTPLEVAAMEPLAAPPLRELWESLAGTLQPIDLAAPLSELVCLLASSG